MRSFAFVFFTLLVAAPMARAEQDAPELTNRELFAKSIRVENSQHLISVAGDRISFMPSFLEEHQEKPRDAQVCFQIGALQATLMSGAAEITAYRELYGETLQKAANALFKQAYELNDLCQGATVVSVEKIKSKLKAVDEARKAFVEALK